MCFYSENWQVHACRPVFSPLHGPFRKRAGTGTRIPSQSPSQSAIFLSELWVLLPLIVLPLVKLKLLQASAQKLQTTRFETTRFSDPDSNVRDVPWRGGLLRSALGRYAGGGDITFHDSMTSPFSLYLHISPLVHAYLHTLRWRCVHPLRTFAWALANCFCEAYQCGTWPHCSRDETTRFGNAQVPKGPFRTEKWKKKKHYRAGNRSVLLPR